MIQKTVVIFENKWYNNEKVSCMIQDEKLGGIVMAETKQYVTQNEENGSVMISEDVIGTIVANAISEVEGIAGLVAKPGADIVELIGVKNWGRGLKVTILEDNSLVIDCNVNVLYGQNVVTVAKASQEAIISAIEAVAGVKICAVNVNICGIVKE